jgi:CPA2 family monovalent cation:H+ antiporter-2
MHGLPPLITDLTLICLYAGIVTVLFKWLKQPVILGYIVAGMLASPQISFLPNIVDKENISIWADIGVIFLLFGLGLEFSFKKIVNVGKTAVLTGTFTILMMLIAGYNVGLLMGWTTIDSLFLGGMISMSSTTIIIKAFDDLNLRKQKFTNIVFGILVIEDVVGILLLVLLPTLAIGQSVNGAEIIGSTLKLILFLVLWFIIGIYVVPTLIDKIGRFLNDELLLIVSVALCLGMVFLATEAGFSSALGAFIMGSILTETDVTERIEEVLKPVKDFFGAVFFVSVGMLVDLDMFVEYAVPILIISIVVFIGKITFSCIGLLLSGQLLKTTVECAFSLAQVGEFAFIIAAVGMKNEVLSDFVYPVIVAVSVLTTFTTPLMINAADKVYNRINRILPDSWRAFLDSNTSGKTETKTEKNMWKEVFKTYFFRMFLFSVILIGIMSVSFEFVYPFLMSLFGEIGGKLASTVITLLLMSPFLRALLLYKKNMPDLFFKLWLQKKSNRVTLAFLVSLRIILVAFFIMFVIHHTLTKDTWVIFALVIIMVGVLLKINWIFEQYMRIETRFLINLNKEQVRQNIKATGKKTEKADEDNWLDSSLYVAEFEVAEDSSYADKTLKELAMREKYSVNIFRIIRSSKQVIDVPRGTEIINSGDLLLLVGTEKQIKSFTKAAKADGIKGIKIYDTEDTVISLHEFILNQEKYADKNNATLLCCAVTIEPDSALAKTSIQESDFRGKIKSLIVGIERKSSLFINPEVDFVFKEGDLVWIVGEQKELSSEIIRQISMQQASA